MPASLRPRNNVPTPPPVRYASVLGAHHMGAGVYILGKLALKEWAYILEKLALKSGYISLEISV